MAAQTGAALRYEPVEERIVIRARRDRRLDRAAQAAARRNISMTRPGRSCSSRSRHCRNITRPAASSRFCATRRRDIGARSSRRLGADRVRQRLEPEGAHPARRRADDRGLCAGRHFRRDARRRRRRICAATIRNLRCCRSRPISRSRSRCRRRPPAHGACRLLPGLDHRQFRAARGLLVPAPCRAHARARRDLDHRDRPREG